MGRAGLLSSCRALKDDTKLAILAGVLFVQLFLFVRIFHFLDAAHLVSSI